MVVASLVFGATATATSASASRGAGNPDPDPFSVRAKADDDAMVLSGSKSRGGADRTQPGSSKPAYAIARVPMRTCGSLDNLASSPAMCIEGVDGGTITRTCTDGSIALDPLYRRPIDADGNYTGPWEQVDNGGCTEDPPAAVILTAADFSRLPLTPSPPRLQPADGHGLVNVDLIVYTDPAPQTLTTTVLGIPVTVRATPTTYTWDYGDGSSPLVTTDPGQPYPHHTVARPYTTPGDYQLTLTTTWTGTYQVNNAGPWLDVLGTATTTSAPQPTHITAAHTVLTTNP